MSCCAADRLAGWRAGAGIAASLALGLALLPAVAAAAEVSVDRSFGLFIGDILDARAELTLPDGARVVDSSVPRAGRISPWLNLLAVEMTRDGPVLRLERRFQLTASAEQVKLLYLPPVELRYRLDDAQGGERSERLPAIPVTVSPLSNRQPVTRAGLGDMRPDRAAPLPPRERIEQGLRLALAALLATMLLATGLRWRARRLAAFAPFRTAAAEIGRHRRRTAGPADVDAGYRSLHRAFDQAAGRTVFIGDVAGFLEDHPRFAADRDRILAFFSRSSARFFGPSATDESPARQLQVLAELAASLARRDRGTTA